MNTLFYLFGSFCAEGWEFTAKDAKGAKENQNQNVTTEATKEHEGNQNQKLTAELRRDSQREFGVRLLIQGLCSAGCLFLCVGVVGNKLGKYFCGINCDE